MVPHSTSWVGRIEVVAGMEHIYTVMRWCSRLVKLTVAHAKSNVDRR